MYRLCKNEELRPETFQLPQTKSFQSTLPYNFKPAERFGAEEAPFGVSSLPKPFKNPDSFFYANGCFAESFLASASLTVGLLPIARAIASLVAS